MAKSRMLRFTLLLMFFCVNCQAEPLVVVLDWFANPNHAAIVIAKQHGIFEAKSLDVEIIAPADPADPLKLVAAGKADIAVTYPRALRDARSQGLPLKKIGVLIDQPLVCLVVLKEGEVRNLKELRGKKIGYSSASADLPLLHQMLTHAGVNQKNIEEINVHYGLTQALLSHKIDAAMGMMRNFELLQLEQEGHPGHAFYPEENGVSHYPELILVAHNINASKGKIEKFIAALHTATEFIVHDPQLTWREFITAYPESDNELNHAAWHQTVKLLPL